MLRAPHTAPLAGWGLPPPPAAPDIGALRLTSDLKHSWAPFGGLNHQAPLRMSANQQPRVMPKMPKGKKRAAADECTDTPENKRATLEDIGDPAQRTLLHLTNFNMAVQRACPPGMLKSFKYDKQLGGLMDTIAKDFHAYAEREAHALASQAETAQALSSALAEKAALEQQVATLTLTQATLIAQLPAPPAIAMALEVPEPPQAPPQVEERVESPKKMIEDWVPHSGVWTPRDMTLDQWVDSLPTPTPMDPEVKMDDLQFNLDDIVKFLEEEEEVDATCGVTPQEALQDVTNFLS